LELHKSLLLDLHGKLLLLEDLLLLDLLLLLLLSFNLLTFRDFFDEGVLGIIVLNLLLGLLGPVLYTVVLISLVGLGLSEGVQDGRRHGEQVIEGG
jgi:hypothetical protein